MGGGGEGNANQGRPRTCAGERLGSGTAHKATRGRVEASAWRLVGLLCCAGVVILGAAMPMPLRTLTLYPTASVLLAALALASPGSAQCTTNWLTEGRFGLDGPATVATAWDPDGPGPLGAQLVFAGAFTAAAGSSVGRLASYDPATSQWANLGNPWSQIANALCVDPNGNLFGAFGQSLTRYTTAGWTFPFSGCNGAVNALGTLPGGDLVATGNFTTAGTTAVNGIARWNGTAWQTTGLAVPFAGRCLCVLANGDVVVTGTFQIGGNPEERVARWNGTLWTMLGSAVTGTVTTIRETAAGQIVVGGTFSAIGGTTAQNVAVWNGAAWTALGSGLAGGVQALTVLTNGELIAGGATLARWDGSAWQPIAGGVSGPVHTLLATAAGGFVAGGAFAQADGRTVMHVAQRTNNGWETLPPTPRTRWSGVTVRSTLVRRDGSFLVGGTFPQPGPAGIARWDGSAWQPLGSGVSGAPVAMYDLPNGDLFVAGAFATAGGIPANGVARWNGSAWHAFGAGLPAGSAVTCATIDDGVPVVGTAVGTYRWDGSAFVMRGLTDVTALATLSDGRLYAATRNQLVPWIPTTGSVHWWNGSNWSLIGTLSTGSLNGPVLQLAESQHGELLVAGSFATVNGLTMFDVARYTGSWAGPGAGFPPAGVTSLHGAPLFVGGSFTATPNGSGPAIAFWNGSTWQSLGDVPNGAVSGLHSTPDGILVQGSFTRIGTAVATGLAEYRTSCPASVLELGPGCAGPGGLLTTSIAAPWLNGTYRSRTTGCADPSLAFALWGFSDPNLSLASLHPLGGAGCVLHAEDDIVLLMVPLAGEAAMTLTVPNQAGLVGVELHHQVVQFAFDGGGTPTGIHAGNGLRLTLGMF